MLRMVRPPISLQFEVSCLAGTRSSRFLVAALSSISDSNLCQTVVAVRDHVERVGAKGVTLPVSVRASGPCLGGGGAALNAGESKC